MQRIVIGVLIVCLIALALAGGSYWATQHVDAAYERALAVDAETQRRQSDAMLHNAMALRNDLRRDGAWEHLFTQSQINGWLAVDLVENHPDAMPAEFSDPRVTITAEGVTLYCRFKKGDFKSVMAAALDVYLAESNVLAVRFARARAGLMPVPIKQLMDAVQVAAQELRLGLQWRQEDGDPVALIRMPSRREGDPRELHLEKLILGEGQIYVAGRTEHADGSFSGPLYPELFTGLMNKRQP